VLAKSLKVRVREPLGDEELEALQRQGLDVVLDTLKQRPGPWVLWDEVVDPADAAENARVYALDDETGEIRFGNGEHGRIPPAGQDAIIAESYMRGGGDEANAVRAWSQITLITPTQGIDRVVVPEGAAGGSDPQDAEAVIRFAPADLLMRDRALTLRDLEKLAERFSTDVAQARAFARAGVVELVVVMRGRDPQPSGAVRRELLRYIGERVPPMLQERGAVTIAGPDIVWTRVHVRLAIADIDHSGAVGREAVTRIARLFDPVDGGVDGTGWRLGDTPTDMDLAAILDGVPDLEGIVSATLSVVPAETPAAAPPLSTTAPGAPPAATASLAPMPPALRSTQLARLVDEGISIEFDVPAGEAVA
jgi:predicted phage baseplate assembly protein